MITAATLIQAQDRYIERCTGCHPGHARRVRRAAWKELFCWAEKRGMDGKRICRDADDVLKLEVASED